MLLNSKRSLLVFTSLSFCLLTGCAQLHRHPGSGYAGPSGISTPNSLSYIDNRTSTGPAYDADFKRTAYEMGFSPDSGLDYEENQAVLDRIQVRNLEKRLSSRKEKEQYSRVLPWVKNDAEKIEFLKIPSLEGRQAWMIRKKIWDRSKSPDSEMRNIIEAQDIAVGMPMEHVKKSWGEPMSVDVSGNPIYRNERWKYQRFVSAPEGYKKETRLVYFEGGRVVGWETD